MPALVHPGVMIYEKCHAKQITPPTASPSAHAIIDTHPHSVKAVLMRSLDIHRPSVHHKGNSPFSICFPNSKKCELNIYPFHVWKRAIVLHKPLKTCVEACVVSICTIKEESLPVDECAVSAGWKLRRASQCCIQGVISGLPC